MKRWLKEFWPSILAAIFAISFGSFAIKIALTGIAPDLSRHSRSNVTFASDPIEYSIVLAIVCLFAIGGVCGLIAHWQDQKRFDAVMRSRDQLQTIHPIVQQVEPDRVLDQKHKP